MTILCKTCNYPMHKSGKCWSGRKRVQRFKCNKCGKTTISKLRMTAVKKTCPLCGNPDPDVPVHDSCAERENRRS